MKNSQLKRQAPETVSTELEQVCAAVPQVLARTSAKLEERYYIRLAKEAMVEPEGKEASPEVKVLEGEVQDELAALRHSARHLVQAYQALVTTEDELNARLRDMRSSRDKKWYALNPPANAAIDLAEATRSHFAQGLNLYKILLICFVGSFAGALSATGSTKAVLD